MPQRKLSKKTIYKNQDRIKEITRLYYMENKSLEELADQFQLHRSTVSSYLRYNVPVLVRAGVIPLDFLNGFTPGSTKKKMRKH